MQEGPNASRSPMWISAYINSYILAFGPSCIEFFHPRCWCFDNGATSEIYDILLEHGGLPRSVVGIWTRHNYTRSIKYRL